MPGLAEAFDRIGLALEHHLPVSHAAGAAIAVTDRHEITDGRAKTRNVHTQSEHGGNDSHPLRCGGTHCVTRV